MRWARRLRKVRQRELAERLGWSQQRMSRVERGRIKVTVSDVLVVLEELGCSWEEYGSKVMAIRRMWAPEDGGVEGQMSFEDLDPEDRAKELVQETRERLERMSFRKVAESLAEGGTVAYEVRHDGSVSQGGRTLIDVPENAVSDDGAA